MVSTLKNRKNELLFVPLGGSGEIGMNLNLYHYKGKWLMIDMGAGFADDYYPGIDVILPDIEFIKKYQKDLVGLVITHAHEDHLGAVMYLWPELQCPIYTTKFTAAFLRTKLAETNFAKKVKIIEVDESSIFNIDVFNLELVTLNHSALEMQAIVIKTEHGNIFHTGDWKFDDNPVLGKVNDEKLLKKYGDEGILAVVGDSTNVFNEVSSQSEGDLRDSLLNLINSFEKMVIVTTFASNVSRVQTIIDVAKATGRKLVLTGRSLWRIVDAAKESGYLKDAPEFYKEDAISNLKRSEILILATGCQGEPTAALSKLANNSHPKIKLAPGDAVIFSSKIIPGNDKRIYRIFNLLVHLKIKVYTERDHFVHVSGHPSKVELKRLYDLIRPKICIPVHGELIHMHEHARLAKEWGICPVQVENGEIIKLAPGAPEKIDVVKSGYLIVDGNCIMPANSPVMSVRRKMRGDGVVIVVVAINKNGLLTNIPIIRAPGLLDNVEDKELLEFISDNIYQKLQDMPMNNKSDPKKRIEDFTRLHVRKAIKLETGKNPVVEVIMLLGLE